MKAIIYVVICLSFCTHLIQCSCLSYGHSCWGGHGKRSSNGPARNRVEMESQSQPDLWTLFKSLQNNNNDNIYRREGKLHFSRDNSMDLPDKKAQNDAMDKRNMPLYIDDQSMNEHERAPPALNYLLRNHKYFPADLIPTQNSDMNYETTPYSIFQSDEVYVPRNNRFYKVLVD